MRPSVIVFDVNETLSDLSPLGARFVEVGPPAARPRCGSPPCSATASR